MMVIDKSTGKGCAWRIASKGITKRLIEEGIICKPFARIQNKGRYYLLVAEEYRDGSVYTTRYRGNRLAFEILWTPSFIDPDTWKRGTSNFKRLEPLDVNVEKYLLPEMEEYLQSLSDADLVSIVKEFLIDRGVIDTPISQHDGATYFFDQDEVYSIDVESKRFPYERRLKFGLFSVSYETCFNMILWRKAVSQFEVGMTLDECISVFLRTSINHGSPQNQSELDKLIQYIHPPKYERFSENQDETTFDFIRIVVGLPRYKFDSLEALHDEAKTYQDEIYEQVVQKLESDRQLEKFNMTIASVKLSEVIFRHDFAIEYIFEPVGKKRFVT